MVEALVLLVVTWGQQYAEQNHGQAYHDYNRVIEEYHLDDAATVVKAYQDQYITFKWEF